MEDVQDSAVVILGLAPLSGGIAAWQRAACALGRPLFDFAGLRAFKERLHPDGWEPVWLVFPRGESAAPHVVDALRAFASGSLLRFGVRSILGHPEGLPWGLAVLLAVWTSVLALLALIDRSAVLGFSRATLVGLVLFHAFMTTALLGFARKPRLMSLVAATLIAAADAGLSLMHRSALGPPEARWHVALRFADTMVPMVGTVAFAWATILRWVRRQDSSSPISATWTSRRSGRPCEQG